MDTLLAINEIVISDEARLNQVFVKQAIEKWDLGGTGSFSLFVKLFINQKWRELVRLN